MLKFVSSDLEEIGEVRSAHDKVSKMISTPKILIKLSSLFLKEKVNKELNQLN